LTTGQIWNRHPEKAFTMRADYVEKYPKAAKALLMAVMEAQMWADKPENKDELSQIVSKRQWINAPVSDIVARYKGIFDFGDGRPVERNSPHVMQFWKDFASYPYKSHDLWFLTESMRWGFHKDKINDFDTAKRIIDAVNREDLWREAATEAGFAADIPSDTSRGIETFFDGIKFDPANPEAYLKSLKIKRV
jgi:nitrate/nitrite transport system substrate-binding protein